MAGGRIRPAGVAAAAAGLAVLVAGCGGGSNKPSVASLGGTTTTTGSGSTSAPKGVTTSFAAFVNCMQRHGVQAQLGQGGHGISISGVDPGSQTLQRAQHACQKLLPGGGPKALTPAQQAQVVKQMVEIASCMRKHGFPNFPDPDGQGFFDFSQANGIDPNSPRFQQAMSTCRPNGGKGPLRIGIRVSRSAPGNVGGPLKSIAGG